LSDKEAVTMSQATSPRYELVDTVPGFVIVEHSSPSNRSRCYFCAEATPPKQTYREGGEEWYFKEAAQSLQFSVRDNATGEVARFPEVLGLLYYGCLAPDSKLRRIGEIAHSTGVSIYIAITYDGPDGKLCEISPTKLEWLNRAFNDRIRTPGKKILILPDLFDIQQQVSRGQIMLDFSLTTMTNDSAA
jgi:hypothetical protein